MARTPRKWQGARTPSGLKRVRQAERRRAILQPRRSVAKTLVAKAVTVAQAQTTLSLQNLLPRARVLYASATGASDVNNLAYATRLGLWGPETAFANREAFVSDRTWATLARYYDTKRLIEIIYTSGGYTMTALAINSLGIQLEPGYPSFP